MGADTRNAGGTLLILADPPRRFLASGAQWNYTPRWNDQTKDGLERRGLLGFLTRQGVIRPNFRPRPYPRHTAGIPLGFHYQAASHEGCGLSFVWEHDPTRGDTEIFVPNTLFAQGAEITCSPNDTLCWRDEARQLLICTRRAAHDDPDPGEAASPLNGPQTPCVFRPANHVPARNAEDLRRRGRFKPAWPPTAGEGHAPF